MEQMQFAMMLLMSLLTVTLVVLLPRQVAQQSVINRSRWLMAAGTALIAVQFFLQYSLRLRDLGVTQAVMVNMLFFIPCSCMLSLSILNLQQQGKIGRRLWLYGVLTWLGALILIVSSALIDDKPLFSDTPEMRFAEYGTAVLYSIMQLNYTVSMSKGNNRLKRALSNYYDYDTDYLLRWMRRGVFLLGLVAVGAPFLVFSSGIPLLIYAFTILFSIYYVVFCFICYCVSNDARKVSEADSNEVETQMGEREAPATMIGNDRQRIEAAVNRWIESGGHLHSGITMYEAATSMQIPRYQLAAWLKTTEWELFNPWLTSLRIEEAKRLLSEHPDWGNDTIAQQCGFSSRSYFQQVFKKLTGKTPTQYAQNQSINN